jgi:hypothetical protein
MMMMKCELCIAKNQLKKFVSFKTYLTDQFLCEYVFSIQILICLCIDLFTDTPYPDCVPVVRGPPYAVFLPADDARGYRYRLRT